ncbi:hypothetical protein BJF78_16140 [Pseudonocardia sp. CNS-139]|nr:hypothetical protein BJF78_16140 [Pseudonocardia sp. CNS-139]
MAARRAVRPPSSSSAWLDVSATECTDSASIDDDPVIRYPMNFAIAIPALASNAATIALVPPLAATRRAPRPVRPFPRGD